MFLVSDEKHTPTALFDNYDDALGYICSWHQIRPQFTTTGAISVNMEAIYSERKHILGYIRCGVTFNPSFVRY